MGTHKLTRQPPKPEQRATKPHHQQAGPTYAPEYVHLKKSSEVAQRYAPATATLS